MVEIPYPGLNNFSVTVYTKKKLWNDVARKLEAVRGEKMHRFAGWLTAYRLVVNNFL